MFALPPEITNQKSECAFPKPYGALFVTFARQEIMKTGAYAEALDFPLNLNGYKRRQTREVNIGDVPLGGTNPIRLQSMTTTDTMDTEATIAQSIRMIEAGCEYVRITAPSKREAENLRLIKEGLRARGYNAPLVADIHFTPNAAEIAARIVEKVRVNPGNYVDKKKFEQREYTDYQYEAELERIREKFSPLVKICKEYGTAMRIGTNHGSLSDRIMNRYGDTPEGMVESAMEFLRICEDLGYHQIVLSMKASNPIVMIQAYRLLVASMEKEGMNYPLHLGVTEAGEDQEGRIKSALGIGTLLEDGLGDTIRVSLTEPPEFEIPVARKLAERYEQRPQQEQENSTRETLPEKYNPYCYRRRESREVLTIGGHQVPRVVADLSLVDDLHPLSLKPLDYHYNAVTDKWNMGELGTDFAYFGQRLPQFGMPAGLHGILDFAAWKKVAENPHFSPLMNIKDYLGEEHIAGSRYRFLLVNEHWTQELTEKLHKDKHLILVLESKNLHPFLEMRQRFFNLERQSLRNPVILKHRYEGLDDERLMLHSATDMGGLLAEGFGDGIWLSFEKDQTQPAAARQLANRSAFNILQASRTRISKTEYISCPSCGRTLFDLQDTTAMIRKRTDHLKGVKIAIMGCIVNGPGEMADADYGYVGTGPGKITLYRGKEVVKRNIDSNYALDELIALIKADGMWIEKAKADS